MSSDDPDLMSPNESGKTESAPDFSIGRYWVLGLFGGCLCFGLFSWALVQAFDQLKEVSFGWVAIIPFMTVTNAVKPRTYREAAIVSVVGGTASVLTLPCLLAVENFADGLGSSFWRDVVPWLGAIFCALLLSFGAALTYQRLARQPINPGNSGAP